MEEREVRRMLLALLAERGAECREDSGLVRFRLRRDGMLWEAACRCAAGAVLVYGRYPFRVADRAAGALACSAVNSRTVHGAMFLPEDGRPVFRTRADMSDIYDARERLAEALRYNAAVIARFWGRFQALSPAEASDL